MSSESKQQKRAKRAKVKAKQARIARATTVQLKPIVPDYFMPDTVALEDLEEFEDFEDQDGDALMEQYIDPALLPDMNDEEREAILALLRDGEVDMPTEDEMLLEDVYDAPAPEPSTEQRIAHFQTLKQAERQGLAALLDAFTRGPVAAHALHDIDFDKYCDILTSTLGAYWVWSEGIDELTVRARIDDDDFFEAMRQALSILEEESIERMISGEKKYDEPSQD